MKENREVARQVWRSPQIQTSLTNKKKKKDETSWMEVSREILANPSWGPPPRADCQNSFVTPRNLCASASISATLHHWVQRAHVKCVVV